MKNTIKKLIFLFLCISIGTGSGCKKEPEEALTSLHGTKWKLEGIVNEQTGKMQVLEPVDCEKCYTFTFDTDSTALGLACVNMLLVHLYHTPPLGIGTYAMRFKDEILLDEVMPLIRSYYISNSKLKFFYQKENINYYFLFKKVQV